MAREYHPLTFSRHSVLSSVLKMGSGGVEPSGLGTHLISLCYLASSLSSSVKAKMAAKTLAVAAIATIAAMISIILTILLINY